MTVIWDSDASFEDYGLDGDGIVHDCHCTHCGAMIQYMCPNKRPDEEEEEPTGSAESEEIPGQMSVEDVLNDLL